MKHLHKIWGLGRNYTLERKEQQQSNQRRCMLGRSASLLELSQGLFVLVRVLGEVFWLGPPLRKCFSTINELVMLCASCKCPDSTYENTAVEEWGRQHYHRATTARAV